MDILTPLPHAVSSSPYSHPITWLSVGSISKATEEEKREMEEGRVMRSVVLICRGWMKNEEDALGFCSHTLSSPTLTSFNISLNSSFTSSLILYPHHHLVHLHHLSFASVFLSPYLSWPPPTPHSPSLSIILLQ